MRYDQVSMAPPLTRMTRNFIIACVVSYFVCFFGERAPFLGEAIQGFFAQIQITLGLVPKDVVERFWLWQPITYLFLHGSPFHLLVNMLLMWFFGAELEMRMGERRFVGFFLLCGALGGLFNVAVNYAFFPGALNTPIIGASGAIYGILGGFSVLFRDRYIVLWFLFPIRAVYFAPSIFLIDLASSMGSKDAIAHFTHIGGMLVGAAYVYFKYFHTGRPGKSKRDLEKEKLKRQFTLIVNDSAEKNKEESNGPYWN